MGQSRALIGSAIHRMAFRPPVKNWLVRIPVVRRIYDGWGRVHPIDTAYDVDTSGYVSVEQLSKDERLCKLINPYAGSSPSVIRKALGALPAVDDYTFIDLGCGKGRAMIIASERPFKGVIGVELSASLANIARRNATTIGTRFPERPAMSVVEGNAVEYVLPSGKAVLFIYHAFGPELMEHLTRSLEARLETLLEHVFIVYYNPVHSEAFDASPAFERWYAATLRADANEVGYAPDDEETVVIWQSKRGKAQPNHADRNRPIVILQELWRAGLA